MQRSVQIAVAAGFVALIAAVPLGQIVVELKRGDRPRVLEIFDRVPTLANLRAYEARLEEANLAAQTLRPWMPFAQYALLGDAGDKAILGRDGWLFYRPGVECLTMRLAADPAQTAENDPLAAIVSFRDRLAARGIRLLVVPVPNKESIYPEMLARRAEGAAGPIGHDIRELLDGLRAADVEVIDLFKVFRREKNAGPQSQPVPLYLVQDTHWSPTGLEAAARAVAARVRAGGWLPPGTTEHNTRPATLRRTGDLVRMLQSPPLERWLRPEEVPCAQVVSSGSGDRYRDDPGAAVLVLGDSFLRIFEQDEPHSAGFVAHLARELSQPLSSIINDGGASTLVRQELYRRPNLLRNKRLVIWEFTERDLRLGAEGWQDVPLPPTAP